MIHILLLIAIWLLVTAEFTIANVVLGILLALGVRLIGSRQALRRRYRSWNLPRIYQAIVLVFCFLWEVVKSGLTVAVDILRPQLRLRPGIVAIPVRGQSATSITILANLITMTPGTLSLWTDERKQILYVHAMQIEDAERFRQTILATFNQRVRGVVQ